MSRKSGAFKGPSQRQLRVGEMVRHVLTQILQRTEIRDDALTGVVISISEVSMTPDLKIANAYVSPLGDNDNKAVVKALNANAKFIRREATPMLRQMKYMPTVRFHEDTSFDNFSRIDALLRDPKIARDLDANDAQEDEK